MSYVKPENVRSPKSRWQMVEVLIDNGAGECSFALGEWDGERTIGYRWNGTDENPLGNPQSRGLPTWTILPAELHKAVVNLLPTQSQVFARHFLGMGLLFSGITLDQESVLLWSLSPVGVIAVKVLCATIRDQIGEPTITDEDCRLVAQENQELIGKIAKKLTLNKDPRTISNGQMKAVEITPSDLREYGNSFTSNILATKRQVVHIWAG